MYYECLDTLIENVNDWFKQKKTSLLIDVEDLFIFSLRESKNLNTSEWDKKLKLEGVSHFSDDIVMIQLKWEFMNVHTQMGDKLN